ncbi:hypothetical protein [Arthrobacter oryzae]|uniref:hypothetical protein n=1 Tax=Arthrobacter oryzae TaxID=409290 RepID=UPI00278762D9|nr:hypothetical protein [Arthrobacter oryzae]MDQ0078451.1 hypothetical protein [Arthrobacter oryzae]
MSELACRATDPAEATRSRATWDGAWSVPVGVATQASAALVSGIRAIPSITHPNEAGHLRPAVKVPVTLSLRGLGDLAGSVSVQMTLSPVAPVTSVSPVGRLAPVTDGVALSFSSIGVGTACASPRLKLSGSTFTADLMYAATAGLAQVDFAIDGYGYCGGNNGHRDFSVTAVITFQEHGKQTPTILVSSSLISL